ncbi:MAG: hypothetical protein K0S71_2350 [Clostridia bacterium]|jgi:hypothetical protein|nr:hypothetical protein [Clostridia bacterium]
MEYGKDYKATAVPVDIVEGQEGLLKVTEFDEIIPFTLRALLKGYKCTDEMLNRVENKFDAMKIDFSPIEFFITYNPHCFASCVTHINESFHIGHEKDVFVQNEIMDLVESLPGSLKRAGIYQCLKSIDEKKKRIKLKKIFYEPAIFDMSLRYLSLSKFKQGVGSIVEERCLMVLYIP